MSDQIQMSHPEPTIVSQITESHLFRHPCISKLEPAIHVFNSLLLDDKTRWYSEKIAPDYFDTRAQFELYMDSVHNKPMDFSTIRENILSHKYKRSDELFKDIELVFTNAMTFNNEWDAWYGPAKRLYIILLAMEEQSIIKDETWQPATDKCRTCPQCNNIMLPTKPITSRRCTHCSTTISPLMDAYICHNHSDKPRNLCAKCVQSYCHGCFNWHVGRECNHSIRVHCNKQTPVNWNHRLKPIDLQVPSKPNNVRKVRRFAEVQCNPMLNGKIETMIKQIKIHDRERHFFKEVEYPRYALLIRNPIHFGQILKRIGDNKYDTMGDIKRDIDLLWHNCYTFNGPPNPKDSIHCGFSNFANDLQWALNEYMKQFEANLSAQNWIGSKPKTLKRKRIIASSSSPPALIISPLPTPPVFENNGDKRETSPSKKRYVYKYRNTKNDGTRHKKRRKRNRASFGSDGGDNYHKAKKQRIEVSSTNNHNMKERECAKSNDDAKSENERRISLIRIISTSMDTALNETDKRKWSANDCAQWIGGLGNSYKQYMETFIDNAIDGVLLSQLDDEALKEIVQSRLHRMKILSTWHQLQLQTK
eukprot:696394_1